MKAKIETGRSHGKEGVKRCGKKRWDERELKKAKRTRATNVNLTRPCGETAGFKPKLLSPASGS